MVELANKQKYLRMENNSITFSSNDILKMKQNVNVSKM